jgi:AcrR family transcriptional regulator
MNNNRIRQESSDLDHWLTVATAELTTALDDVLDLDAGLAHAQIPGSQTSLTRSLDDVVDLDAGLNQILPTTPPATTRPPTGNKPPHIGHDSNVGPQPRGPRATALRNRQQILRAAVDIIVEQGPTATMELIARRAKVGIATLYRHFPDRSTLLRQVALDTLHLSAAQARAALVEEPAAATALARFMHDAIDLRIGAVMSILADHIVMDDELLEARRHAREEQEALTDAAHQDGSLRPDVTSNDINLLIIRLTTPLPGSIAPQDNHRLSHSHLELLLDGLLVARPLVNPATSVHDQSDDSSNPGSSSPQARCHTAL